MTVTSSATAKVASVDTVTLTVDGIAIDVPKGTLIIRAAEQLGIAVPRFCDHPLLDPVAACRMCLIEVEGQPKPQPACAVTCSDGMVVRTQFTSAVADEAQRGVMEFLLINHPLDCPVCDKGGECPLQNQAMTEGNAETRFDGAKRLFPKPINVSAQVLLDRERCVSCARCTRFSEQIAGDPFIELIERGAKQQVGIAQDVPFNSYYSGNTIQICPVGALTSALYRFRARPFDLVSTPTTCEHCASGCSLRTDVRRGSITRRLAASDPDVNEDWNCDKGRFGFRYVESEERITHPMVRDADGTLRVASWPEALAAAAEGLRAAGSRAGVVAGGRLTVEDAYAYSKFARVVLGTNNVDFRARASSAEEADFLASSVAGRRLATTYEHLDAAPTVLLVALEPEDESPIIELRLRKAARRGSVRVFSVAPLASRGLGKVDGQLVATVPGDEARALTDMLAAADPVGGRLREPGAVILVGERAAALPGTLSAVVRLADETGAAVAWVPRRAGERGAVEAGLLPGLLPCGRPVTDAAARVDTAAVWGVDTVPERPGLDLRAMVAACVEGELSALLVAGVDVDDLPDADGVVAALDTVGFLVCLDTHQHAVTERADVVLPVAVAPEKAGSFLTWEGRERPFAEAVRRAPVMPDSRVLSWLADEFDVDLGLGSVEEVRREVAQFDPWTGSSVAAPAVEAPSPPASRSSGELVLGGWRPLIDTSTLQSGEPYLAATARPLVARVSAATAASLGASDGADLTITGPAGSVRRRVQVTSMPDGVVVLTEHLQQALGAVPGALVAVSLGGAK
ncbi:MAG: NADH-quinone oxidoreductase subunit G [Actinomycetes bacterium]